MLQKVEADIKAAIKEALGDKVREIGSHPGHWGASTVKHMVANAPSVYVGFSAGTHQDRGTDLLNGKWHVYLVGRALNGKRDLGIYQLLQQLLPKLHGLDLDQADALQFKQVKNLFSFAEGQRGVCCYEMIFDLSMNWPDLLDASSLDDWLSYHAEHYDTEDNNHLMAADTVTIPTT